MFDLEKTAAEKGSKTAYISGGEEITYAELWKRANSAALLLRKQGTGPVIIYGDDGIDPIISVFACLLAGRPYVPVSTSTPAKRLQKIIESASCSLLLKAEGTDAATETESLTLAELNKYEPCPENLCQGNTAYIIFTSGSTGEPKGVPISRANLLNFIDWIKTVEPLPDYKDPVVLNTASLSFDLSVAAVYYALCNGYTLVSLDRNSRENCCGIFEVLSKNRVNVAVMTPTFARLCLLDKDFSAGNFPDLQCIFFCGERLENSTAAKLFLRFPNLRIINAYGPTEATCAVSAVLITTEMTETESMLPVGRTDTSAVKITAEDGELLLRGKSVFSGYLGAASENCFVKNGENCFRTGDLGYIEGGKIYCSGRKDSQIKYKGYRIELGEIEAALSSVEGVREAAATARKGPDGNVKMIKAFVSAEPDLDESSIKAKLKELLPGYMVPKTIEIMEKLPVNKNGKIDRKLLMEL
ncbi:MAG: AMP-binding protein [Oscillospiraceae bacterium]